MSKIRIFVNPASVENRLAVLNLRKIDIAKKLGLSVSYTIQILNGRQPVSASIRNILQNNFA